MAERLRLAASITFVLHEQWRRIMTEPMSYENRGCGFMQKEKV